MAYKSLGKRFYNSEAFTVKPFNGKFMCLTSDDIETSVELKFTNHFKPMYAMTVHKAQGMTINRSCSVQEHRRMKHDMF